MRGKQNKLKLKMMQRMSKVIKVVRICMKFGFKSISLRSNTKIDMTLPRKRRIKIENLLTALFE